jgi:flagellar biosynthesis protein FlhG
MNILAFASGKGGVGKTSLVLNLATLMAQRKKRILVFDGDFGLANVDVQLGLAPRQDLSHVLTGATPLKDIVVKASQGFWVVPGRSGSSTLPFMTAMEQHGILNQLKSLAADYDAVLVDVPAGLDNTVLNLCAFADKTIVIATPDPSAITDAYALIKLLHQGRDVHNCHLLVNQAGGALEGKQTATKITEAARHFLKLDVPSLPPIPYDRNYAIAIKMQEIPVIAFPTGKSSEALATLAGTLLA